MFSGVYGQTSLSSDMESTMRDMQLEYIQPVEKSITFVEKGKIRNFDYDFGIEINGGEMLILVQTRDDSPTYVPQIAIPGLVSTLATNDQDFDIRMMGTGSRYLKESNSDWAIESLFIPKKVMTDYKIAYIKALFKEGIGSVNILYLSNEEIEVFPILKYSDQ